MMKYLQKLGKALMLPVAALPVASIFMGIGYWIDPTGWGANNIISAFLLKAGGALIDNMAILFAIGVGVGMSDDNDGSAGLAGLVSWLVITTVLSSGAVAMYTGADADPAFAKIGSQFTGILAVAIGTAHGVYKGIPKLDLERLSEIRKVVSIPLVLHGTSGVPDETVTECVNRGICKVNYATDLRIAFTEGVKEVLSEKPDTIDPKKYNAAGREKVKAYVMSKMIVCGSNGRA